MNDKSKSILQANTNYISPFVTQDVETSPPFKPVVDIARFSSYDKLLRVTTFVFKFLQSKVPRFNDKFENLDPSKYLIKLMQSQCFDREITFLNNSSHNSKDIPKLITSLNLFLDEDAILRSKGRIDKNLTLDKSVVNPIILGKNHILTKLLIHFYHEKASHMGTGTTLNYMRSCGLWIIQGRQSVNKVLRSCMTCKKINSLPYAYPKETDLPKSRVNLTHPFQEVGVDYMGPIMTIMDKSETKMYILLFTCMATRAVHLELLPDMSTKQFVLAMIRFTSLYGQLKTLHSDNARSFIKGFSIFQNYCTDPMFIKKFGPHNIKHVTVPSYSPWVSGAWERMVRVVKACIRKSVGRSKVTYFELLTLISDIKQSINSRPLTYIEKDEDFEIISPNSFIHPLSPPESLILDSRYNTSLNETSSKDNLIQTLRTRDKLLLDAQDKWTTSYLLNMQEKAKDLYQPNFQNNVKVNQIVMIKNPLKTRPFWTLGRIVELFHGADNIVRSVMVYRSDKTLQKYSIKHLYPLELSSDNLADLNDEDPSDRDSDAADGVTDTISDPDVSYDITDTPRTICAEAEKTGIAAHKHPGATRQSARVRNPNYKKSFRNTNDPYYYY